MDVLQVDDQSELTLDKSRKHTMRCIVAFGSHVKDEHEVIKQHVFVNAVELLVKDDEPKDSDVNFLIKSFVHDETTCEMCDWHALHWAAVLGNKIKEEVVHEFSSHVQPNITTRMMRIAQDLHQSTYLLCKVNQMCRLFVISTSTNRNYSRHRAIFLFL